MRGKERSGNSLDSIMRISARNARVVLYRPYRLRFFHLQLTTKTSS